jgi:hypothetical protein
MLGLLIVYTDSVGSHVGYAMSHDGGDSFMRTIPVSPADAKVTSRGESGPQLAATPQAIYVLWQQRSEKGANQLAVARSVNFGKSFDPPVIITGDESSGYHGFAALGVSPKGEVYVVWLDGREAGGSSGTFAVYISRSIDRGVTFDAPHRVALSACPCCRPAITFGPGNEVIVAWRKVFAGEIRDMVVSVSKDGGQTFAPEIRVAEDGWRLNACPDSGPSFATKGNRVYLVWLTEGREQKARVQLSWSDDLGKSFHVPVVVSQGVLDPNHPRLRISEDGSLMLAFQGRASHDQNGWGPVRVFLSLIDGDYIGKPAPAPASEGSAAYPALGLGTAGRIYLAWTGSGDPSTVYLLRGRL